MEQASKDDGRRLEWPGPDLELADKTLPSIRSIAPTRIDFAGGPTDVQLFASREGGSVVNGCISLSATTELFRTTDSRIYVRSEDLGITKVFESVQDISLDGDKLDLLKAVLIHLPPTAGMGITTRVEVPPGSGLGASASLAVCMLDAVHRFRADYVEGLFVLAQEALFLENQMMGNTAGGQDQYAAALGGFHAFEINSQGWSFEKLSVPAAMLTAMENGTFLCYSGKSHVSGSVLDEIMANYIRGDSATIHTLRRIRQTARDVRNALISGDYYGFAEVIDACFACQMALHQRIVTPEVRSIISSARVGGALSAKMVGAGGGGCVFIVCEQEAVQCVRKRMEQEGYRIYPIRFVEEGVKTQVIPAES